MKRNLDIRKWDDYLAFGISALFSPYILAVFFIVLLTYSFAHDLSQFLPWVLTFLVFGTIIPGFYVLWLIETEKIRDIHISELKDRQIPFWIAGISSVLGAILLMYLGAARPVIVMSVTYALNALIVALITQYWKISIHMVMLSSIITVAVIVFGFVYVWAYFLLVPLAWSRVHRKRHTVLQVTVGAVLAFLLTSLVFWGYGYF